MKGINYVIDEERAKTLCEYYNVNFSEIGEHDICELVNKALDAVLSTPRTETGEEGTLQTYYVITYPSHAKSWPCVSIPNDTRVYAPFYGRTMQEAVDSNIEFLARTVKPSSEHILAFPKNAKIKVYEEEAKDMAGNTKICRNIFAVIQCHVSTAYAEGTPGYKEYDTIYNVPIYEHA